MFVFSSVLCVSLVNCALGTAAPPARPYKFLMLLPVSSESHRNVFLPLAEALANRGHEVVMLVNHPPVNKHVNITEINHGLDDFQDGKMNWFTARRTGVNFGVFKNILPKMAIKLYKLDVVEQLFKTRNKFDLMIVDHAFNELTYPFVYGKIFITLATPGLDYRQSAVLGNVLNPSYYHTNLMTAYPSPMSLWHRMQNMYSMWSVTYMWRNEVIPKLQEEIDKIFPDLPPLLEIEKNQSLALLNSHFSIETPIPLLPSQIEVGGMHCKPGKALPKDLEEFITGAGKAGVIYFSIGTVAKGNSMPAEFRNIFVEAFKRLEQRVLWKFEDEIPGLSKNVRISKWLPQQDVLAHPNVKVFITHGGGLSTQEASYHGVPVLAVPIFSDQPKNAMKLQSKGLGRMLIWEEMTVEDVVETLQDLTNNPKYRDNLSKVSAMFKDQMESATERAVFWTEYVVRHHGAPLLRSPALHLSWIQYLMIDVLATVMLALLLCVYVVWFLVSFLFYSLFGKPKKLKTK